MDGDENKITAPAMPFLADLNVKHGMEVPARILDIQTKETSSISEKNRKKRRMEIRDFRLQKME